MNEKKMSISGFIKLLVTVCLLAGFAYLILRDFDKARVSGLPPVKALVAQREKVQQKARAVTLNHFMPSSYDYLIGLADGTDQPEESRFDQYVLYYKKVTEYLPQMPEAYALLGFCYAQLGRQELAVEQYQQALSLNPRIMHYYLDLGILYLDQGNMAAAKAMLEKAVQCDLQDTLVFESASRVYFPLIQQEGEDFSQNAVQQARANYRKAFRLLLGILSRQQDHEAVLKYARQAIAMNLGENEIFYYYAGLACYQMDRYPEALTFFQQSVQENENLAESYFYLGQVLKALGQDQNAEQALLKANALHQSQENSLLQKEDRRLALF